MKTNPAFAGTARATRLLAVLLLLALPTVTQAQFTHTVNNGTITITRYTGPGGAVTIPGTIDGLPVTSIGNYAFSRCPDLTSVTIPDGVTSIGESAFDSTATLASITIPHSVTSIGAGAFVFCSSLVRVTIPSGVTSIGGGAFSACFSLTSITVDPNNTAYSSVDGVLFNKSQTTLIQYPAGKAGSYTIPDTVTNIRDGALWNCHGLTSVMIPNGITSIQHEAFAACNRLTRVMIPRSITHIGAGAFDSCASLKGVYFYGDAPNLDRGCSAFTGGKPIVYYLADTTGWDTKFSGRPTMPWNP